MTDAAAAQRHEFQAEVARLLEIVAHSLYSDRRVFLRELVSNAADACDRLRYESVQKPELTAGDTELKIALSFDKDAKTLTIADNGIGMSREEMIGNLGTIARSGTSNFVKGLSGDAKKDLALIGQFGVGFYSSFMVAGHVEVTSRRADSHEAWRWRSDGKGSFEIEATQRDARGTDVVLYLKDDALEFLDADRLGEVVRDYADHIAVPVVLKGAKTETLNQASALWTRAKNDITAQQYDEFYRHLAHRFDSPWATLHWRAEGRIEYTGLLYIPSDAPFDLFHPERQHAVKLYVRRVFITEKAEDLLPRWLRFVVGVVDSADLPLNVSREMLQNNPILTRMRQGLVSKILSELDKRAKEDGYAPFWQSFGSVLKEGLVQDREHQEKILELCRFKSTAVEGWTSLADVASRMKEGQDAIYYASGESAEALRALPQLEGYLKRGVDVLLLTDHVDDFWLQHVAEYKGKKLRSITRGADDLAKIKDTQTKEDEAPPAGEFDALLALLRLTLEKDVKDVRLSQRLEGSAVCLVADDKDLDFHLEKLLRQHKQIAAASKRILEINPRHALIRGLATAATSEGGGAAVADAARLLLDQARIVGGEAVPDPASFARRIENALLACLGRR